MDELLTRFTERQPCWNRELLLLAGEAEAALDANLRSLAEAGLLEAESDIFWLTEAGQLRFRELATECYLDEKPGARPKYPKKRLDVTRLWLELERCNRQAGGEKRYIFDVSIPVRPGLERLFACLDDGLRWLWPEHPEILAMQKHFPPEKAVCPPVDGLAREKWLAWRQRTPAAPEPLHLDLLLLCHYDMVHYLDFRSHPNDALGLINTDRFAFVFAQDPEFCLNVLGRYQLWLHELRLAAIPGYLDVDTQQQDSANWLLFVTSEESRAKGLATQLARLGEELIRPATPMELWTVSLESLKDAKGRQDVIWEVLPFAAHAVWPPRL